MEFLIHKHIFHTPLPIFSSSGILQKETWQGRIVYNQSQKGILQEWFKQNPYPDRATRKQWAKEIGIPEAKIQIWFKNHRSKQRQLEFGCSLGKDETQRQHHHQPWTQEYLPKAARQDWTSITRSQSHVLLQAFERNRFLDITTRKKLAKKAGIQEPRIQMWFQNQRSLYPEQSRNESVNSLADGPNGRPGLTAQQHQINLSTPLGRSHHLASSNSFSRNQTFLPAPLPSHESSVPCVSQGPSVMMVQPMKAMQTGENSVSPQTLRNHLPIPSTSGGDLSDTQTPFWLPNQEKCQNHEEQTGTGVLQLKGYCEPHPEHQDQLQDLEQVDIPYILQRWDEVCQALTAKWDPREGTH
ncbi:double homeobox protein B [Phoca vitulina]|uniref:double homeobox protein B n=1 Tax=Phoca vitulina TaxID=9720 RepID=UPI001396052F|nr:double homeobox protein B [Phoca vitulina]